MSWVNAVTQDLNPETVPLVVALDPDGLLTEEAVHSVLQARGYDVLKLEDDIAFRFAYESKYRGHPQTPLMIVAETEQKSDVPFDMLMSSKVMPFGLASLFPNLSTPVIRGLDRGDWPALYDAQQRENPSRMNDGETKKFILLHVYGLVPEVLRTPADLLRELLRLHYAARSIPPVLGDWLVERLSATPSLQSWPLKDILADRQRFFHFLQDRWPGFLYRLAGLPKPDDGIDPQPEIPFAHQDVRVYLDNLFTEGRLTPVAFPPGVDCLSGSWAKVGVIAEGDKADSLRLGKLLDLLAQEIPAEDARYRTWLAFAPRWAEASVLWHRLDPSARDGQITLTHKTVQTAIDSAFSAWLSKRYSGLHSQPPVPPVMLHHIPRTMARDMEENRTHKAALVVLDGMAWDQWLILRPRLTGSVPHAVVLDDAVFAWVPTLTSVSRQAIFSGKPPVQFGKSIGTTAKEPAQWAQFWADHGIIGKQVEYRKGLGEAGDLQKIEDLATRPQVKVLGLVVDKIDRIMHGAELGLRGMHSHVALWGETGYLSDLVGLLIENGFSVYLTADHGNVEAVGIGRQTDGVNAEERGERVRTYSSEMLRQNVKQTFPSVIEWQPIGLPADYLPILASGRDAFVAEGKAIVGHGGASLEEVIVPFVRIERT